MSIESILKFIVVVLILYVGYQLILKHTPLGGSSASANDSYMDYSPAAAKVPDNIPMPAVAEPRVIVSGGPSTPSQAAPIEEAVIRPPPVAKDPYDEPNEGANAPENLRHPERMFRPAPPMDAVDAIADSGIGGAAYQATSNAMQVFAPEFAQNGGQFMDGIFANDLSEPTNFSMF